MDVGCARNSQGALQASYSLSFLELETQSGPTLIQNEMEANFTSPREKGMSPGSDVHGTWK